MATSTSWPLPLAARSTSAVEVPTTANNAASESPRLMPVRAGRDPASPVVNRMPPMASPMLPKPASRDRGPVWPSPETCTTMMPGLSSASVW